jgi:hypothetical protein
MYYVMTCEGLYPSAAIDQYPSLPGGPWMDGQVITFEVPQPLIYTLDPDYPGKPKPMYVGTVPVMRDDLVEALNEAGVDNVQFFPAVLRNEKRKKDYANYQAFNVVGVISCADMTQSKRLTETDSEMIDVDFDQLVIDESKIGGALLFRLAEDVSAIVVHEKIKQHIEDRKIPGMTFYGPGEWSG